VHDESAARDGDARTVPVGENARDWLKRGIDDEKDGV